MKAGARVGQAGDALNGNADNGNADNASGNTSTGGLVHNAIEPAGSDMPPDPDSASPSIASESTRVRSAISRS